MPFIEEFTPDTPHFNDKTPLMTQHMQLYDSSSRSEPATSTWPDEDPHGMRPEAQHVTYHSNFLQMEFAEGETAHRLPFSTQIFDEPAERVRRIEQSHVVGSWDFNAAGEVFHVERGKVERVTDDGLVEEEHDELDPFGVSEPLPASTTPPPRPALGGKMFLPLSEETGSLRATGKSARELPHAAHDALSSLDDELATFPHLPGPTRSTPVLHLGDTTPNPRSSVRNKLPDSFMLNDAQELDIVESNLRLVEQAHVSVHKINSMVSMMLYHQQSSEHVHSCARISISLGKLSTTLERRRRFDKAEWQVGSQEWRRKYSNRLLSARRTLQKLCDLGDTLESRQAKSIKILNQILPKLQQYELKLVNLASKFNSAFDRLRARYYHGLLSEAHAEGLRLRANPPWPPEYFQHRWAEGKAAREKLRGLYYAYRRGRHTSSAL